MNTRSISATGAVTYFSLGPSRKDLLEARLADLGLAEFAPKGRTDEAALKQSLGDLVQASKAMQKNQAVARYIVPHKDHKTNGFEVAVAEKGTHRNEYSVDFSARVESGRVCVRMGYADVHSLQRLFETYKSELAATAVSGALVKILAKLEGVALREAGGVYWLPEYSLDVWRQVIAATEAAKAGDKENKIYILTVKMDQDACRAVRDAIVAEVTAAAVLIDQEVRTGTLGEEALENRQAASVGLLERVEAYESILGEALSGLKACVNSVQHSITVAALGNL